MHRTPTARPMTMTHVWHGLMHGCYRASIELDIANLMEIQTRMQYIEYDMHPVSRHRASWQEPSGHYVKSVRWQYGGAPVGKLQPYVIRVQVGGCTCLINIIVKKIIVVSDVRSFHNILILDLDLYGIALHDCIPSQQHACIVLGIGSRHQRHALVRMHGHVHVQRLTDCCIPDKGTNITRRCKWHPKETTLDTMRNLWMCPAPPPPSKKHTHTHTHALAC